MGNPPVPKPSEIPWMSWESCIGFHSHFGTMYGICRECDAFEELEGASLQVLLKDDPTPEEREPFDAFSTRHKECERKARESQIGVQS